MSHFDEAVQWFVMLGLGLMLGWLMSQHEKLVRRVAQLEHAPDGR